MANLENLQESLARTIVKDKIKVIVFCGGRGAKTIIESFSKNPIFEISAIINAYDDGLSTGYLRRLIPGFLGPSDVRKNMSYLIDNSDMNKRILKDILEYRFPKNVTNSEVLKDFQNILDDRKIKDNDLSIFMQKLSQQDRVSVKMYLGFFMDYITSKKINFDFDDCSLGNILLSGCFLKNNKNFNRMIEDFSYFLKLRGKVYNISLGENLVLTAMQKDGKFLPSEASIVEKRLNEELEEIFLLKDYFSEKELKKVEKMNKTKKVKYLHSIEQSPILGEGARYAIEDCDVLIYGPGTQNSSLFPTYLTKGFAEAVVSNKKCKKIFISNIGEDNEIPRATVDDIIDKAVFYMNRKGELSYKKEDLIDFYFVNSGKPDDSKYIKFENRNDIKNAYHENFEHEQTGKHSGEKVMENVMNIAYNPNVNIKGIKKLSIVIPAYNESKFILELLNRIRKVDFSSLGFLREIIVVENGSQDNTYELIKDIKDIKTVRVKVNQGKGYGVIKGIEAATGDIIVIQDADLEYNPEDIREMLKAMLKYKFKAVYGSRTIKKEMKVKALTFLHGKHPGAYWSYYIGGQILSFITFFLFGEYITDTVTGYKMVDAKLLKSFILRSHGFELDHEITAKILKRGFEIYEIPISYKPRSVKEGKKIKWIDGLIAMKTLLKFRFIE